MTATQQKIRRIRLLALIAAGVIMRDAARRMGVTERTAYAMKAKAIALGECGDDTPPQLDLFPAA